MISYTDGKGKGTFEISGDSSERKKHIKNLKDICLSEGLNKIPFMRKFVGRDILVKYRSVSRFPQKDFYDDFSNKTEDGPLWNTLEISLESKSPTKKVCSLGNKIKDYVEKTLKQIY